MNGEDRDGTAKKHSQADRAMPLFYDLLRHLKQKGPPQHGGPFSFGYVRYPMVKVKV